MGLFAPGVAQGYLDYQKRSGDEAAQTQIMAQRKQAMDLQALQVENARSQQARDLQARQGAGATLGMLGGGQWPAPPPVGDSGGQQPPQMFAPGGQPGQASVPAGPPGPGYPQGPGAGPPPTMAMQGGQPQQPPPIPPYRTVQSASQPPAGQPQQPGMMGPPQVAPQAPDPTGGQRPTVKNILAAMKQSGVPVDQWVDQLEKLKPVMDEQNREQVNEVKSQIAELKDSFLRDREGRLQTQGDRKLDNSERRTDAYSSDVESRNTRREAQTIEGERRASRLEQAKRVATAGGAPTKTELDDPETARVWYDIFKTTGKQPPFAYGKSGQPAKEAWTRIVANYAKEDGQSGTDVAAGQIDAKANTAALTQLTKDMAAIRPYSEMLDKNSNILIKLAEKVGKSDSPWANRTINYLNTHPTSDPDVTEFLAQMRIVQTEAARVLNNPRLVGQLTDSARKEMESVIDGNMSLASTKRVIARLQSDGQNRIKAMEREQEGLKGKISRKPAGAAPAAPPAVDETKTIGGVTYHKVNGQWMQ